MRVIYIILISIAGFAIGLGIALVETGHNAHGVALTLIGLFVAVTAFLRGAKDADARWAALTNDQRLNEFNKWRHP